MGDNMSFKTILDELEKERKDEMGPNLNLIILTVINGKISAVKECEKMVKDAIERCKFPIRGRFNISSEQIKEELGISEEGEKA